MRYKLVRMKQYWALILKGGDIVGVCHRGTGYIWYFYINTQPPKFNKGEYPSVEEAFNAFITYQRRHGKR